MLSIKRNLQSSRNRYLIFGILLIAFAIRFFFLNARTFHGDEGGSLTDAVSLTKNLQALSYFVILRFWLQLGASEFWLRSLSAMFSVAAVAAMFTLTRRFGDTRLALAASGLFASAPFAEVYAQQVRFYSLFLFAACVSLWIYFRYLDQTTRRNLLLLILANLFLLTTHASSVLLIAIQALGLFLLSDRLTRWHKVLALGMLVIFAGVLVVSPIKAIVFNSLAAYTDATETFTGSRGISVAQVAKIPATFFFFTFGESVYPLTYALVVPGALVVGAALFIGIQRLYLQRERFIFVVLAGVVSPVVLYLVLDSLIPPGFAGAAPRYLVFLLPLFYLAVALGARGKTHWLIVPLLLVNISSLALYWFGDWAYTDDLVNWREVAQWVGDRVTPHTVVITDGRAQDAAKPYFPSEWDRSNSWNYQTPDALGNLNAYSRIILLSYDFRTDKRTQMDRLIQMVASRYKLTQAMGKYPLFIYVYDRNDAPSTISSVDSSTGRLGIPPEIYGTEYQDLRLPLVLDVNGRAVQSLGAFGLPSFDKQTVRTFALEQPMTTRRIWLMSTLIGANPSPGEILGMLTVRRSDGNLITYPLRAGYETNAWDSQCQASACLPAFTWRKRLALVGSESYPGSWREFDASIFTGHLDLAGPVAVQSLTLERSASAGTLYIWGIVLES